MIKATYSEKLLDPRWQRKRLEVLQRDEFKCQLCQDTSITLHIHHLKYGSNPWDTPLSHLITYCEHCHSIIEYNKKIEKIKPIKVLKRYLESGVIGLSLIYIDEYGDKIIDIYDYSEKQLIYHVSIGSNTLKTLYNEFNG